MYGEDLRAKVDELEDQIYPDGDGSEIAEGLKEKEYRLKKLKEVREVLEREKLKKVNVTDPESRLMKDSRKVIEPSYNGQIAVDDKEQVIVAADVSQNATDQADRRGYTWVQGTTKTNDFGRGKGVKTVQK